jgi:hypothetical protein
MKNIRVNYFISTYSLTQSKKDPSISKSTINGIRGYLIHTFRTFLYVTSNKLTACQVKSNYNLTIVSYNSLIQINFFLKIIKGKQQKK